LFHHDDSLNDRTPGMTLDKAFQQTQESWKDKYQCEYNVIGGMYCGEPPLAFYNTSWTGDQREDTSVEGIRVPPNWYNSSDTSLEGEKCFQDALDKSTSIGINNNPKKFGFLFGKPNGTHPPGYYHIYTKEAQDLHIKKLEEARCCCWISSNLERQIALAKARLEMDSPGAPLDIENITIGLPAYQKVHIIGTEGEAWHGHGGAACGASACGGDSGGGCGGGGEGNFELLCGGGEGFFETWLGNQIGTWRDGGLHNFYD
jgi:hypothetical protein